LRQTHGGRSIFEICREANISEISSEEEVSRAKRSKELDRESAELKKMLAESLLTTLCN
jgi:hypothetical protein